MHSEESRELSTNRKTFPSQRLTRSRPLARLLRNLRLRQILLAASQAARISLTPALSRPSSAAAILRKPLKVRAGRGLSKATQCPMLRRTGWEREYSSAGRFCVSKYHAALDVHKFLEAQNKTTYFLIAQVTPGFARQITKQMSRWMAIPSPSGTGPG